MHETHGILKLYFILIGLKGLKFSFRRYKSITIRDASVLSYSNPVIMPLVSMIIGPCESCDNDVFERYVADLKM